MMSALTRFKDGVLTLPKRAQARGSLLQIS